MLYLVDTANFNFKGRYTLTFPQSAGKYEYTLPQLDGRYVTEAQQYNECLTSPSLLS